MHNKGFTLLELLVAIVIFAIMSVMAYGGLNNVISNSEQSKQTMARLQQLQHAISILNRDINQIRQRDIRDEFGNPQPYLTAGNNLDYLVEFTRGGRMNPANLPRSSLLRLAYRFDDDKLVRLQWPYLDRAQGTEARETVLLDKIDNISIRFQDQNAEWHEQWPPLSGQTITPDGTTQNTLKLRGIEITMQLVDWGEIRRLYAIQD